MHDDIENILHIDGSQGEGGGQILRTSLSLSALTGRPFRLEKIRAGRSKPGLRPQHLTAVRAAAMICDAVLVGGEIGSQTLEFWPSGPAQGGSYLFDVTDAAPHGRSAGAVSLVLQTILWPLLYASEPSRVALRGGTHVPFSPSFHYLQHVTMPAYRRFGIDLYLELTEFGWMEKGNGQMIAEVTPLSGSTPLISTKLGPNDSDEGYQVEGVAVVTNLPGHIPHRMARRADNLLKKAELSYKIDARRLKAGTEGAGIFLWTPDRFGGAHGLGRRGKAAQDVSEDAVEEIVAYWESGADVDAHLADQLLIPAALSAGQTTYSASEITQHTLTNRDVILNWLPAKIQIDGELNQLGTLIVQGCSWNA